ncbi:MAG: acyl-CoA reductase [Flavobacteriales bacterium]|nr:acyl-CoA reductase [Flavobacteriales bacterium]
MNSEAGQEVRYIGLDERISAFVQLGKLFGLFGAKAPWPGHSCGLNEGEFAKFDSAVESAKHRNAWFIEENVRHALIELSGMLEPNALRSWLSSYDLQPAKAGIPGHQRTVGLITAGNIPFVGFHDLLCVLLSGHRVRIKISSDDAGLTEAAINVIRLIAPDLGKRITVADRKLGEVDAVIATGSTNTARHFEHYFGQLPRIIRKNRTSVALLDGTESEEELLALGEDLFRYFGLGCRNVSKLYLPRDFDLDRIFKAIFPWKEIGNHHKWANNYEYHKAIWLMDRVPLIENGFVLFREDSSLHSPLGSIYYERFDDRATVETELATHAEQLQCIVGHGHLPFGSAQCPGPQDYADGVDTMKFLLGLA